MAFYSEFSRYYETVFPFRKPVFDFLDQWLPRGGRLLDLGCGTGAYCEGLATVDRSCLGVDLDPEMIDQAQKKYPTGEFQVMGLESIGALPEGEFDGVYCIGNVMPHLGPGKLAGFLVDLKGRLQPGGIWIFQTVNFDPIVGQGAHVFPVLKFSDEDLQFHRQYTDRGDGSLDFKTRLVHAGREIFAGKVALCPRTSARCLQLHEQAGFELKAHFADFNGKPFVSSEHSGSVFVFKAPEET